MIFEKFHEIQLIMTEKSTKSMRYCLILSWSIGFQAAVQALYNRVVSNVSRHQD